MVIWPQEALLPTLDNDELKIYVYPEDPLMKICIASYGLNVEEAKNNVRELVKLAPDFTGMGLMIGYLDSFVVGHEPKEFAIEEIKELIKEGKMFLRVGDTAYGAS